MKDDGLTRERVVPLLDTDDLELQQTVLEIMGRRPGWSGEVIGLLRDFALSREKPGAPPPVDDPDVLEDLALLRELDERGRVAGAPVETLDEALDYLRGLEREDYLGG